MFRTNFSLQSAQGVGSKERLERVISLEQTQMQQLEKLFYNKKTKHNAQQKKCTKGTKKETMLTQ